jgi:hypothetical protein
MSKSPNLAYPPLDDDPPTKANTRKNQNLDKEPKLPTFTREPTGQRDGIVSLWMMPRYKEKFIWCGP